MRADRLLDLVALLRRHERLSAAHLARRLGVSRRTVLRDLDALSLSGVPVYAVHGRGGGFALVPGYRPERAGLTPGEATALFLPGGEAAAQALGRGVEFRSARGKLEAVLSDDVARSLGDLTRWLLVAPEGWGAPQEPPAWVPELAAAAARRRTVDVIYRAVGQQPRTRRLQPLGLVLAGPTWYLLARRHGTGEQRTYRIDRVVAVAETGEEFAPVEVSLGQAWAAARESLRSRGGVVVRVRVREETLPLVKYVLGLAGQVTEIVNAGAGLQEVTALARLGPTAGLLAGLGDRAEILSPPELRAAIVEISRANIAQYAD